MSKKVSFVSSSNAFFSVKKALQSSTLFKIVYCVIKDQGNLCEIQKFASLHYMIGPYFSCSCKKAQTTNGIGNMKNEHELLDRFGTANSCFCSLPRHAAAPTLHPCHAHHKTNQNANRFHTKLHTKAQLSRKIRFHSLCSWGK